ADADITILYDRAGGTMEVDVVQGKSSLNAQLPLDQPSHLQVKLAAIPLAWLKGLLAAAWPDGRLNGGTLEGNVALDLAQDDTRASGRIAVSDADLDSKSGTVAAQKFGADGNFRVDTGLATMTVMWDGQLHGGQLLLGPLFAQLPQNPVGLHVAGSLGPTGVDLDSLTTSGSISGSLDFDDKGLHVIDLMAKDVTLDSHGAGLAVAGFNGGLD